MKSLDDWLINHIYHFVALALIYALLHLHSHCLAFAITYIHADYNGNHLHNQQVSMLVPWWDKAFSNNLLAMWSLAIPCSLRVWSRRCMTLLAYQKQQGNRPHTKHHAFISFSHLPYLFGPFGQIYVDFIVFLWSTWRNYYILHELCPGQGLDICLMVWRLSLPPILRTSVYP